MDEIKRASDPCHGRDYVKPPNDEAQPFGEHGLHEAMFLAGLRRRSMAEAAGRLQVCRLPPSPMDRSAVAMCCNAGMTFGTRIIEMAEWLAQWSEAPPGLTCTYLSAAHRATAAQLC